MQSILLVGEQRSGSNLLRLMLNNTGEIGAPHPPHVLQRIDPIVPVGEIVDEQRFAVLVEAVCRLVETNPVQWLHTQLDRRQVQRRCRARHVVAIFAAVMEIYAESNGARMWLCKSMQNIRWSRALDAYLHTNKYVYLHRDPRDVALSFSKAVVGDKHVYFIAKQWAELQRLCLDARKRLGSERVFSLGYTGLIGDTEATLRALCGFLGTSFRPEMIDFHESEEARNTAVASTLWQNVARPVMQDNHDKFRRELSEEQIRIIEIVAGRELEELGYERMFSARETNVAFEAAEIERFRAENERLKKLQTETTDPADLEKRKRQEQVLVDLRQTVREWSGVAV